MRTALLVLSCLLASVASAAGEFTSETAIQAVEASDAADEARMSAVLSPSFVAVRGRGEVVSRDQYLSDLRSLRDANRFAGLRRDWTEVKIRVHDDTATFAGRSTWKPSNSAAVGRATASTLVTQNWRRIDGEWKLFFQQSVRLGLPPDIRSFRSGELQLRGMLFTPEGKGKHPAIVYAHGNEPDPSDLCESVAPELVARGYVVWCPHRRGAGLSQDQGENLLRKLTEIERRDGIEARSRVALEQLEGPHLEDIAAAVSFARGLPSVHTRRMFLMGNSFGGVLALLAAEREIGIAASVDFAGAALNWERSPQFRERLLRAARNARIPVFLGQAANDFSTGPTIELGKALAEAKKRHRAIVYPAFGLTRGEGHSLGVDGVAVWAGDVLPFVEAAAVPK